jgi:hypothetical protein
MRSPDFRLSALLLVMGCSPELALSRQVGPPPKPRHRLRHRRRTWESAVFQPESSSSIRGWSRASGL